MKTNLKLLEDNNGEVQNLAVKCLGTLVNKVKENQVVQLIFFFIIQKNILLYGKIIECDGLASRNTAK